MLPTIFEFPSVRERLDAERDHEPDLTDVRRTLREALTTLDNIDQHRTAS